MSEDISTFKGSVPKNYDDHLGPLLFEDYAKDLAGRINFEGATSILELAAGTGRLTRYLIEQLPQGAQLVASDLNADMLAVAKEKMHSDQLTWQTVDMLNIPFDDNSFDLIVCQFGVMLVPDHEKALQEIYRVLKKDGKLVYSVWGDLAQNGIWEIGGQVISSILGVDPIRQKPGPFSMQNDEEVLDLMIEIGFRENSVDKLSLTGRTASAALAAKGFIQGLPVYSIIKQRHPDLVDKIQSELAMELARKLGDQPMSTPLLTLIFEATK